MIEHLQINDVAPCVHYQADGVQAAFIFPFAVFKAADLEVWVDKDRVTTGITVSGVGISSGGSVLFGVPPAAGRRVTLRRRMTLERTSDFQTDGIIRAKTLNDELDYQVAAVQQVADDVSRCLRRPFTSGSTADLSLPDPAPGKALGWNTDGSGLVNDPADFATVVATVTAQAVATAADRVQTNVDRGATAADRVQTGIDREATAADRVQTGIDRGATAADRAQITIDAAATAADRAVVVANKALVDAAAAAAAASASNALNSENASNQAKVAAEAARDAVLQAYDNFDDRYLGEKAAAPALDNDGNPLTGGALYFDSTSGAMQVYTGSVWVAAYVSGTGFLAAANNLSDIASPATARANLGVTIGTAVQAWAANLDWLATHLTAAGKAVSGAVDAAAQRIALGLVPGTAAGNVVVLDAVTAKLPAVDGSLLTNLPSVALQHGLITSGTTWVSPANTTASTVFKFTLVGGGGGSAATQTTNGRAGGGGATAIYYASGLSAGTAYAYTIGAAGAGGVAGGNNPGGDGGNTTLTIGATTITAGGGKAGLGGLGAGGAGGIATNGHINIPGGSAGYTNAAYVASGGNSTMGNGAGANVTNAGTATGYGGGGAASAASVAGSPGTPGCILVEWVL